MILPTGVQKRSKVIITLGHDLVRISGLYDKCVKAGVIDEAQIWSMGREHLCG